MRIRSGDVEECASDLITMWTEEIGRMKTNSLIEKYPMETPVVSFRQRKVTEDTMLSCLEACAGQRKRTLRPFCEEVGVEVLPDKYSRLDKENKKRWAKKYVSARSSYALKMGYEKIKQGPLGISKFVEHEREHVYLFNLMVLLMQNTTPPGRGFLDWIEYRKRGQSLRYHKGASCKQYINLTKRDLKSGCLDNAIKRTICFLAWHIFSKENECKESLLSLKESGFFDTHIYIDYQSNFGEVLSRHLSLVFSELILAIGNVKYIEFFYETDPGQFPSEVMTQLIRSNLDARNMIKARHYLDGFNKKDKLNPAIEPLENEYNRLMKISALKDSGSVDLEHIDRLSGIEFEEILSDKFLSLGFSVKSTPSSGDFGADIIVETQDKSVIVVQCKRYQSKVNLKAVQEVVAAMPHYGGDYGVVITNNGFLNSARKLAESSDIELWGRDQLIDFMSGDLSFSQVNEL